MNGEGPARPGSPDDAPASTGGQADHSEFDIAIVGAGIAGASVAYFASGHARVLLLEAEAYPGMHSTGRSAAMFMESYGSPQVRALTRASRPFLERPPAGFAATPLLSPRGALYIGSAAQAAEVQALHATLVSDGCPAELLEGTAARALVPVLRLEAVAMAVLDPLAADIDAQALHQGYLRGARAHGATLVCDAEVLELQRQGNEWTLHTRTRRYRAAQVVNAAGAWVDVLAGRAGVAPIGIEPRRRSAFVFAPPPGLTTAAWPCVATVDESCYFKPEAGLLLGSPANADPVPPHDVMPEEWDIALGIARIEAVTTLQIRRPRRTWAGLRSFVADGNLVGGHDPLAAGFFWLAALGGYGIQTSPALGAHCAARLLGLPRPAWAAAADEVASTLDLRPAPACA
jgi:D-arginine dehydrogenase